MPIPTRSLSTRESRKQPSAIGRPTTSKTTSTATADNATTSSNENAPNRTNKSLLPIRDEGRSTNPRPQQQESRPLQRGIKSPVKTQQPPPPQENQKPSSEPSVAPRRQSLMRPSPLKTTPSIKPPSSAASPKKTTSVARPPSPPKQNGRPTSPKKNDMPPPPRPMRSASVRQPVTASPAPAPAARGHARHRSQVVAPASAAARNIEPPSPSAAAMRRPRAQFTTYQQHYSPKKTAKPPSAVPAAPAAVDLDPSLIPSSWPEIAALQTELLQLSLLQGSSVRQNTEWQASTEAELRSKYDSVAERYRAVLSEEKGYQRRLNAQAVQSWRNNAREHNGRQGFAEQIQVLSQVAQEVCDLSNRPDGRYTLVVEEFEAWFQNVEDIKDYRRHRGEASDDVVFIESLGPAWKEEVYGMTMKLELCQRQLQSLDILGYGEVEKLDNSVLCRTAKHLDEMATLMVEELSAIRKIEVDVVRSERAWVSHIAQQLTAAAAPPPLNERVPRVGMWRRASLNS